jgi:hypothetical protein
LQKQLLKLGLIKNRNLLISFAILKFDFPMVKYFALFLLFFYSNWCRCQHDTIFPALVANDFKVQAEFPKDSTIILYKIGSIGWTGKSEMQLKYRFLVFHKLITNFVVDELRPSTNILVANVKLYSYENEKIESQNIKYTLSNGTFKIDGISTKDSVCIVEIVLNINNADDYYPFYFQSFYPVLTVKLNKKTSALASILQGNYNKKAVLNKESKIQSGDTITTYSIVKNQAFAVTPYCNYPKIYFDYFILKYKNKLTRNWNDLAIQTIESNNKFLSKNYFKASDIKSLCPKDVSELQKTKNIYNWIHNKYGILNPKNKNKLPAEALVQLIYAMTKSVNINTSLIITNPKDFAELDTIYSNLDDAKSILCGFKIDNRWFFTDMSNPFYSFGQINEKYVEAIGLDCKSKQFTTLKNKNKSMIFSDLKCKIVGKNLEVAGSFTIYGNKAGEMRQLFSKGDSIGNDVFFKSFKNITNLELENKDSLDKPLKIKFKTITNYCITFNDTYINFFPLYFFRIRENPFAATSRNSIPIEFENIFELYTNIEIPMPKNYLASSLPRSFNNKISNGNITMDYAIEKHDNVFNVITSYTVNKYKIDGFYYFELRNFYQKLIQQEAEALIFAQNY